MEHIKIEMLSYEYPKAVVRIPESAFRLLPAFAMQGDALHFLHQLATSIAHRVEGTSDKELLWEIDELRQWFERCLEHYETTLKQYDLEMVFRIRTILIREWDPIGVNNMVGTQDEYNDYVEGILRMLESGADQAEITQHLHYLEYDYMGLSQSRGRNESVAARLLEVYTAKDEHRTNDNTGSTGAD
jgi:hypothetical protein